MKKIITVGILYLASHLALADLPAKPEKCPEVSELQSFTMNDMYMDNGKWIVVKLGTYGTKDKWELAIFTNLNNKDEAFKKARSLIATVKFKLGPGNGSFAWMCAYAVGDEDGTDADVVTMNPPLNYQSYTAIKSFLKK